MFRLRTPSEWWYHWFGEPEPYAKGLSSREKLYMVIVLLMLSWIIVLSIGWAIVKVIWSLF